MYHHLYHDSKNATTYEEWQLCQDGLDALTGADKWRSKDQDKSYDWLKLGHQLERIEYFQDTGDVLSLCGLLRSHPVRNICRVLSPSLYNQARGGTKLLIERYITRVRAAIRSLSTMGSAHVPFSRGGFDSQTKTELFHDTRQAFGRSTLLLQGGSTFSMVHLGVVKALHLQGLLPKVITGTATGSLIAALVGVHTDETLLDVLKGDGIKLGPFRRANEHRVRRRARAGLSTNRLSTFLRRLRRLLRTGHFFDISVLEECARENLGNITFHEAYLKTGRILNITVALPTEIGVPQLLNHITAPHVLIWSAVAASTATSKTLYAPVSLFSKDPLDGTIRPHLSCDSPNVVTSTSTPLPRRTTRPQESPLKRIGELFNVNHFIVSQARPYIIPFIHIQRANFGSFLNFCRFMLLLLFWELLHWLYMFGVLARLPMFFQRLAMDETIPNASPWAKMTLVPDLSPGDLKRLFDTPTKEMVDEWVLKGERSVWPAVCELRVRSGIEVELDAAYEHVRRRAPNRGSTMVHGH